MTAECGLPMEKADLGSEADFSIRFTESLAPRDLTYLGLDFAGFGEQDFYVLHHKTGQVAWRLPFDRLGGPCELTCQSGLPSIPLLNDLLALYCQFKGFVALHASAFQYRGRNILVMGWAKGGKTEALLAFSNHDAAYLGDECVLLSPSGDRMVGLPMPLTVSSWMARDVSGGRARPGTASRLTFVMVQALDALHRLRQRLLGRSRSSLSLLERALPVLRRAAKVRVPVGQMFSRASAGTSPGPDTIFLMLGHARPDVRVQRVDSSEVAARMRHSHAFEQMHLMQYYHAFRFAFPQLSNPPLERLAQEQASSLTEALAGRSAYKVEHPYPVRLERLFEGMRAYCELGPGEHGHGCDDDPGPERVDRQLGRCAR